MKTGVLFSVGIDSGWIPHCIVFCAYFVPMLFSPQDSDCSVSCESYHMIMLGQWLPVPMPLVHFLKGNLIPLPILNGLLVLFFFQDSINSIRFRKMSAKRFFTGDSEYPFLWIALLLCLFAPDIDIEGLHRSIKNRMPIMFSAFLNQDDINRDEQYDVSNAVVFCAVFVMAQFMVRFNEVFVNTTITTATIISNTSH